jgi:nucleoside 2-deoxyribosyltransferase
VKLYIGCSLAHASTQLKQFVPEFKKRLRIEGHEVLEFVGEISGTEAEVYQRDLAQVRASDALIAFVDEPSIGLGMELSEAILLKKPILCLQTEGRYLSRMVRGARDLGLLKLEVFKTSDDAIAMARRFLQSF